MPFCDALTALRRRPFSLASELIAAFWRRDRRRALRNWASTSDNRFDSGFPIVRSLESLASDASPRVLDTCSAWRNRATSLRRDIIVPRLLGSTPACQSSLLRRATSACRDSAFCAAWRACFASSAAASSLRRDASKRDFHEPASLRADTSAHRNFSARPSAASARARSRSARACSRSYNHRQSHGSRVDKASGEAQSPSLSAARIRAVSIFWVRIAMAGNHNATQNTLPVPLQAAHLGVVDHPKRWPYRHDRTFTIRLRRLWCSPPTRG